MAVQSVKVNVGRVGGLSHALTENVQIEGKSDCFPPRFDSTDYNDSNLSKTERSLTVAGVSTNAQQITIQKWDDDVYELKDRFHAIANTTYGGNTFESRLKKGCFTEDAQPTVDLITDPFPFMITAGEKRTVAFLMSFQCPYSVNVQYSIVSLHRISTEALGGSSTSIAGHERTSGRLVIRADGGATTLDLQTMEDGTPESEEKFLIAFHIEGHTPVTPKHTVVNTFTSDSATKMVVVKIMDDDTPQPSQHLVYLCEVISGELTNRPHATLKEGKNIEFSVMRIGDSPFSNFTIPPKFRELPANEAIFGDYQIHTSETIGSGQKSRFIKLRDIDDSLGERHHELLTTEIDDAFEVLAEWAHEKGSRWFRVVMESNDVTSGNLLSLSTAALTAAVVPSRAMYQHQLEHYRV